MSQLPLVTRPLSVHGAVPAEVRAKSWNGCVVSPISTLPKLKLDGVIVTTGSGVGVATGENSEVSIPSIVEVRERYFTPLGRSWLKGPAMPVTGAAVVASPSRLTLPGSPAGAAKNCTWKLCGAVVGV